MANEPIVEFYIQNYGMNGSIVTTETLFETIPLTSAPVITEPKVKNELGKASSFDFGLELNSPYYDSLRQMRTMIRVTLFGRTIFRGRVLTIDKAMSRTRKVHCEGDFSFLLDSHQIGTKEDTRPTIGVYAYLQQIIAQHNSDMTNYPEKQFVLGEVPGNYTSATATSQRVKIPTDKAQQKFGDTSWNMSMDRLEGLLSDFGGYFRTRYDLTDPQNPVTYLDWYDNYYNASVNTQTIEVTKNLIDLSGPTEIDNIFTVVVPIGKRNGENVYISDYWPVAYSGHAKVKHIMVHELETKGLYTHEQLNEGYHHWEDYYNAMNKFGKIWKTIEFENANTPEKLFKYAIDWIKNNYTAEITQWSVTALDMKILDSTNQGLFCGDRVNLIHPEVDRPYDGLTIISAEYDLYNPDKDKYVIGIPSQQVNAAYGTKTKSGKKGSGISSKNDDDGANGEAEANLEVLKQGLQTQYSMKTDYRMDIQLDDPYAFTLYNTDGSEKSEHDAQVATVKMMSEIAKTRADPTKQAAIKAEAERRGVSIDDPQLLIDFTPSVKALQDDFKNRTEYYMINTLGMTYQEASVLVNESAGQSWLASWVDDEGNWTQKAIDAGVLNRTDPEGIKQQAIKTRSILNGEHKTKAASILNGFTEKLTGLDLNLGDYVNFSLDDLTFDIGEIFNTSEIYDAVTGDLLPGFKLESITTFIDGLINPSDPTKEGGATFGNASHNGALNGWTVTINKPMTYTWQDPTTGTAKVGVVPAGSVAVDDLHFTKKYDSLRAKLLVVDQFIADQATVNSLVVTDHAEIADLKADSLTTANFETKWANVQNGMRVHRLTTTHSIDAGDYVYADNFIIGHDSSQSAPTNQYVSHAIKDIQVVLNQSTNIYTLQVKTFQNPNTWTNVTNGSFSRATSLGGNWSGGALVVSASPQNQNYTVGFDTAYGTNDMDLEIRVVTGISKSQTAGAIDIPIQIWKLNGQSSYTVEHEVTRTYSISNLLDPSPTIVPSSSQQRFTPTGIGFSEIVVEAGSGGNASIDNVQAVSGALPSQSSILTSLTVRASGTEVSSKDQGYTLQNAIHTDTHYVELLEGTNNPIIVGRISTENVWEAGRNAGYDTAYGYVSLPSQAGSGEVTQFTVGTPNSARTGADTTTFQLTKDTPSSSGGYASVVIVGQNSNIPIGRISLSNWWSTAYQAGATDNAGVVTSLAADASVPTGQELKTGSITASGTNITAVTKPFSLGSGTFTPQSGSSVPCVDFKIDNVLSGRYGLTISVTKPTITYDSETHRYTATARGTFEGTEYGNSKSELSSDQAYLDGRASALGEITSVGVLGGAISGDTTQRYDLTVRAEGTNLSTVETVYKIKTDIHSDTHYVELQEKKTGGSATIVGRLSIQDVWQDGYDSASSGSGIITSIVGDASVPSGQELKTGTITASGTNVTSKTVNWSIDYDSFTPSGGGVSSACIEFKIDNTVIARISDSNLIGSCIKNGVSIFGVPGSYAGESYDTAYNAGMAFQIKDKVVPFVGSETDTAYNNRKTTITSNNDYYVCAIGYPNKNGPYSSSTYDANSYATAAKFTVNVGLVKDTVWTQTYRPTKGTEWSALKGQFEQAIENGDYCCIRFKLGGVERIFWCEC